MRRIVDKNIPGPGAAGLFLLPGATGVGKTHAVCEYIAQQAPRYRESGCRIYFTTRMLKNLPARLDPAAAEKQLERAYRRIGRESCFDAEVVVLKGAWNHLKSRWASLRSRIEPMFAVRGMFEKEFAQYARAVEEFLAKDESDDEDVQFYETQRSFVRSVALALEKAYPGSDFGSRAEAISARRKALFEDPAWSWIPELWPDHRIETATVVLLSLRKFTLPLVNVLEHAGPVKDSLPPGSLVFIDEFDDAKTALLDFIIDDCMKREVDLLELSRTVGLQFLNGSFLPSHILDHSSGDSGKRNEWLEKKQEQYEKLRDEYRALDEKYRLRLNPLSDTTGSDAIDRFMNRSFQPLHWTGTAGNRVLVPDEANNANWIRSWSRERRNDEEKTDEENGVPNRLADLARDLSIFIDSFLQFCNDLILNKKGFLLHVRERSGLDELINWNLHDFIFTVIHHFVPERSPLSDYLYYALNQQQYAGAKGKIHPGKFDIDQFFTRGFYRILLEDAEYHGSRTRLMMLSFGPTPEVWIAALAKRAFVFGLSATAYIEQPLTNFSLGYLRRTLGDSFRSISGEDLETLEALYESSTKGYDSIRFCPEQPVLASCSKMSAEEWIDRWTASLKDRALAERIYNEICLQLPDSDALFPLQRYDRVFQAMTLFASEPHPNVLYAILPNLFRDRGNYTRKPLELFRVGLRQVHTEHPWQLDFIDSRNFEEELERIRNALARRERHFVCTSYETMSRGVNAQFSGADFPEAVRVHEHPREDESEMDIDGVFLEKPTNVFVAYDKIHDSPRNMFTRLVQLHYLAADGYLTERDLESSIRKTVAKRPFSFPEDSPECEAINAALASQVLQALGRMSRTGRRMPHISILAQQELLPLLASVALPKAVIRTREYEHLVKGIKQDKRSYRVAEQRIEALSNTMNHVIGRMLERFDSEKVRAEWTAFRDALLRTPTPAALANCPFAGAYCEILPDSSMYWYHTEDDFATCRVSLSENKESGWSEVSERASGLSALMEVEGMREEFMSRGYACEWSPSPIVLNPVSFNNIYRGALGEAAAAFFFRQAFGWKLERMPEEYFEKFDFMIEPGVYVDSKFWAVGPVLDNEAEQVRIRDKLRKIGGKKIFVLNTFPASGEPDVCLMPSFPELVLVNALFVNGRIWKKAADEIRRLV